MIPKSLRSLQRSAGGLGELTTAAVVGGIVAISVPILAVILGIVVQCLIRGPEQASEIGRLSRWLPDLGRFLPQEQSLLWQVTFLLGIGLTILVAVAVLLYFFYRTIHRASVAFEVALIAALRTHAKSLATVKTLSAQQTALTDCLDYHLPRVRASLSRWWRTFPRHFIQLAACVLVAFLIQPMLSLLTLIATALVVLIYRFVDRARRTSLPVVRERAAQQRAELTSLCLQGPLLEAVHDEAQVTQRFNEQLAHYRRDAMRSLNSSSWKTPTVIVVASILAILFLFVIAVQILQSDSNFSIAGAFTFSLCYLATAVSAVRLQRSYRDLRTVENAADELDRFLSLKIDKHDGKDLKTISRVVVKAEMDHVTVQDSNGRKLLENVSAVFKPGLLIGVVASQRLQSRALVELLMGFGRPVSGRLLFDDCLVSDVHHESLARCAHWIASDGSIVTGTVRDNLIRSQASKGADLNEAVRRTKLAETLQQLPDGLDTLITPGDDRLRGDAAFRIGLARAALTNASIMVIEEPVRHFEQDSEQQTLEAIRGLVGHATITVVLPQRLVTLRQCDSIVMLHEHKVTDIGSHAELLQRNEFYRHLNYLRYNPYRSMSE